MHVVSSTDEGHSWAKEFTVESGKDLREPHFLSINGTLFFFYFEAGTNLIAFEPSYLQRKQFLGPDLGWSAAETWGHESEVGWQYEVYDDVAYTISYSGEHYSITQFGQVSLFINMTLNGLDWEPLGASPFYTGGISEVGWAFDDDGVMWGVGRNEDGDASGWGSRIFFYDPLVMESPQWTDTNSDPYIYESPRMFNHEGELYLIARTDPLGPFRSNNTIHLPDVMAQHLYDLVYYSLRPHGTALWRLNRQTTDLEKLLDLPGIW